MIKIEEILIDLGIEYKSAGLNNFKMFCINPDHDETSPSMMVHKESGLVNCFGCGLSGNIFTILNYFDIRGVDAIVYLQKFAKDGYTAEEIRYNLNKFIASRKNNEQVEQTVKYGDVEIPQHRLIDKNFYLEKRGITEDEIKKWNIAVVTSGRYSGWILIPIYQDGIIRNYFLRDTFGSGKIYGNYPRHDLLAGLDFCKNKIEEPIYVVEGIFDAISLGKTGVSAVACLANRILKGQFNLLKNFKNIVIVPDNDVAGSLLVKSAGDLIHCSNVYVSILPENKKDANECTLKELYDTIKTKIPWNLYMIHKLMCA